MKIKLFNWVKKRNDIQSLYVENEYIYVEGLEKKYPLFISMIESDVYAYTSRFMIKDEDIDSIKELIKERFEGKLDHDKVCLKYLGQYLNYYFFTDIDKKVVDVITNNVSFIEAVHELKLTPPSPQTVFPDVNFETIGSLQGQMEYWWNVYWAPFWDVLDNTEKMAYIDSENLSADVIEFLQLHE